MNHARHLAIALGSAALLAQGACAVNPSTGAIQFTAFMSPAAEAEVGRAEHPKMLAAFGGAYGDDRVGFAVAQIGRRLQLATGQTGIDYTFSIVDSDVVNAFALPGGFVYVSRGLMALANSEAELAGVMAHEIGHVVARHSAERYSRGVLASLGAGIGGGILGAIVGAPALGDLAQLGAAAYVQGFSRDQEFQADELGVRYLSNAGYDPVAMATFLSQLALSDALEQKLAGRESTAPADSLFASHPRTAERVARAVEQVRGAAGAQGALNREPYLRLLDGMIYGDDPEQGYIRGRRFLHPKLRFAFEVPEGFRLRNSSAAVLAQSREGALIRFDSARNKDGSIPPALAMNRYLLDHWVKGGLDDVQAITVNGMPAATGARRVTSRQGAVDARFVAIRYDERAVYRFIFVTPPRLTATLAEALRRTTHSFRRLEEAEARELKPLRLRIHQVKAGETVATLAATLPFPDFREERFRTLNGMGPSDFVGLGQLVKLIGE